MRYLLAFILFILFTNPVLSQQPSKEEIQVQMKEAKAKAMDRIRKTEADIAEAKKNGESPGKIAEMEKNLAMLKKMLGVVDKAVAVSNQKRPEAITTSSPLPPYKSPFVKIMLKQPVVVPTEKEAKDRLLWYKGKKINANTLVTTTGRVVQYQRSENRVVVQPNNRADSPIVKLVLKLNRSRQWTNTYVNTTAAKKNSFFDYPLVMMTMREFDLIEQEYNKIADNTIKLPGTGTNLMASISQRPAVGSGPFMDFEIMEGDTPNPDAWLRQMHQELLNLLNNPPPLDFPAPPKHELDLCYYCDTSLQAKYYREKDAWGEQFNEYESKLIRIGLTIYRQLALLGSDISNVGIPNLEADIERANKFAMQRWEQKLELLKQRYANDVYRQEAVVTMILVHERQKALLGTADENVVPPDFDFLKVFEDFIRQRIAAKDYNVIFNYALILGHERQKALLGVADEGHEMDLINEIVNLNRFALTVQINFNVEFKGPEGPPSLLADGDLSTAEKVYVKLGRNKDCKWQFYLFDADYSLGQQEIDFKIPVKVNGGSKTVPKYPSGWVTYPYAGPAEISMNFPSFRISFCQGVSDSAIMDIFRYETEDISGYDMVNNYTVDLLGYVNKMLVSVAKTKDNREVITDLSYDMVSLSAPGAVDNPTGYPKLDELQIKYNKNLEQHELKKRITETTRGDNTVILFDAQNGTDYLINSTTNAANSELAIEIKSGVIKLKVVLEPL